MHLKSTQGGVKLASIGYSILIRHDSQFCT